MVQTKKQWLRTFFRQYINPPKCAGCAVLLPIHAPLSPFCPDCRSSWEREKLMPCKVCGLALMDCRCLPKAMEDAGITEMIARVPYRAGGGSVPDRVLFSIKAERTPEVFSFLAEELRPGVALLLRNREILPQDALLTALPRRREAISRHGFDQAVELCRALSRESGIPSRRILLRRSFTAEEKTLTAEERVENCRRAFYTRFSPNALDGRTVLLVDDLVTTGSSLAAGAELLYRLGAKEVIAVVVGRTLSLSTDAED